MTEALGARRNWLIWLLAAPIAAWAVVRLFGIDGGTSLNLLMAFTPYAAVVALLATGLAAALRNWAAMLVCAAAAACLALVVLPRALGDGEAVPAGAETVRVLSANLANGAAHPGELLELVERHRPDLVTIEEVKPLYIRRLQKLGIGRYLRHSLLSGGASSDHPGQAILSRLPIRALPGRASADGPRVLLRLRDGRDLRVADVSAPTPGLGDLSDWRNDLRSLPATGGGLPWLLIGDFNATLDQSELRNVVDRGYRDAGSVTGEGLVPTWPTDTVAPPLFAIDHVLADKRIGIADYGVDDLPGSDHHAIHATLFLPRGQK